MSNGKNSAKGQGGTSAVGLIGSERVFKIIISVIVLTVAFLTFWFMMDLVIMTFILTFVFYHFQKRLDEGLSKVKIGAYLPHWVSLIVVYAVGLTAVGLLAWGFTTVIIGQSQEIARTLMGFDMNSVQNSLDPQIAKVMEDLNIYQYINTAIEKLGEALLDLL
ncbi:MAG: hypothetical protein LBL54_03645, partial [Clostridiales Family XIII bacterium]|nr:hypothetical protein [Clostridiales Family XIII bacterium]